MVGAESKIYEKTKSHWSGFKPNIPLFANDNGDKRWDERLIDMRDMHARNTIDNQIYDKRVLRTCHTMDYENRPMRMRILLLLSSICVLHWVCTHRLLDLRYFGSSRMIQIWHYVVRLLLLLKRSFRAIDTNFFIFFNVSWCKEFHVLDVVWLFLNAVVAFSTVVE